MEQLAARNTQPQVAVIGAGILGASIAFQLSRYPVQIVILDQAEPGSGASSHSFAWINASAGKEPASYHDLNRRSVDMWGRFVRELQTDTGLRWGGELRWATTADDAAMLRHDVAVLQQRGHNSRLLSEAECRQLEPGLELEDFIVGALSPNDGVVEPRKVIQACLQQVQTRGGQLKDNTTITGFAMEEQDGQPRVTVVQTTTGPIPCDRVVLAAGLGTTQLAAMLDINFPQQDSPGVVVRTDPQAPVLKSTAVLNMPPLDATRPGIHICQRTDGTVLIGEGSQESLARDDSQEHADELLARATHYLPALAGAKAIPVPVGYRPMPLDGLPVLGFTKKVPNVYLAVMHSGVTLAPLVGEFSAIEIVDGVNVELFAPYRVERFG
jgi:glycine/D-amino acid oxidase-like deaminating enzyme